MGEEGSGVEESGEGVRDGYRLWGEKGGWVGMNVWDGGDHRLGIVTFAIRDLAFGFLDAMKMKAKR